MIIATRVLKLRGTAGDSEIPIRIFAPEQSGGAWSCRYEIDWPDGPWAHAAAGADSVQALLLALQMIGTVIYTSGYHRSGNLFSEAPGRGYGFPLPQNLRDQLIGEDRKFS
jgi:uncharacterized protein DUF6968